MDEDKAVQEQEGLKQVENATLKEHRFDQRTSSTQDHPREKEKRD